MSGLDHLRYEQVKEKEMRLPWGGLIGPLREKLDGIVKKLKSIAREIKYIKERLDYLIEILEPSDE